MCNKTVLTIILNDACIVSLSVISWLVGLMVLNTIFNNISAISWRSVLLVEEISVITKLPNSEQSYKGKVNTHNYINRQNQSTTGKL